jgi:hypothetical protein
MIMKKLSKGFPDSHMVHVSQTTSMIHIRILIDKSYSMQTRRHVVVNGFNEFLSGRKQDPSTKVSVYVFSDELETIFENEQIQNVDDMTIDDYVPSGCTALYDSIIQVIHKSVDENHKTILLILTDGEDNRSFHAPDNVRRLLEQHSDTIQPVFLGSNMDAILSATELGIPREATLNYDDVHLDVAIRAASDAVGRYSSGQTDTIEFDSMERSQSLDVSHFSDVMY